MGKTICSRQVAFLENRLFNIKGKAFVNERNYIGNKPINLTTALFPKCFNTHHSLLPKLFSEIPLQIEQMIWIKLDKWINL